MALLRQLLTGINARQITTENIHESTTQQRRSHQWSILIADIRLYLPINGITTISKRGI
jgi:hypothetical protein